MIAVRLWSLGDLAYASGHHRSTITRWRSKGKLQVVATPGGGVKIPVAEVARILSVDPADVGEPPRRSSPHRTGFARVNAERKAEARKRRAARAAAKLANAGRQQRVEAAEQPAEDEDEDPLGIAPRLDTGWNGRR